MKEKKTYKFTIASGWSSTIKAYGLLWAVTKLKEKGHDVKHIEELDVFSETSDGKLVFYNTTANASGYGWMTSEKCPPSEA